MVDDLSRLYGSLEKQVAEKTRDLERRNESLGLLYETTRMLAEKPVDSESLTRVLSMVRQALGVESGAICSIHGDSARGMPLARDESTVKACRGVDCHNCADGGRVTWRTEPGETGERRILGIPLVEGGVSYGVMPLVLPPGKGLEVWQLELAETMGRHIGGALASAERRDEHRRLGVLEERAAIARELHDSLAQSLSYTKIQLARLAASIEREGHSLQSMNVLMELREGINSAYRELRELLTTFRLGLGEEGFAGALRDTVAEFERRSGVHATLDNDLLQGRAVRQRTGARAAGRARGPDQHRAPRARAPRLGVAQARRGPGHRGDDRGRRRRDQGRAVAARPLRAVDHARPRPVRRAASSAIERRQPTGTRVRLAFNAQTAFGPPRSTESATSVESPQ